MGATDVVKKGIAAVEAHDFATLGNLIADDFMLDGPVPEPIGKAAFMGLMQALTGGLPDWKFNATYDGEEGDAVHVTNAISGTHTGTLNLPMLPGPVAPTGTKVQLPSETAVYTVTNGKLSGIHVNTTPNGGVMGILKQIGVQVPGM